MGILGGLAGTCVVLAGFPSSLVLVTIGNGSGRVLFVAVLYYVVFRERLREKGN